MKRNRKENNTDFITDGYNSAKIEETIKEIRNKYDIDKLEKEYLETDTEYKMISEEYKFFKERYPFLFDMTLKPLMDMDRLRYMLNLREDDYYLNQIQGILSLLYQMIKIYQELDIHQLDIHQIDSDCHL